MKKIKLTEEEKSGFIKILKLNKEWTAKTVNSFTCRTANHDDCIKCPLTHEYFETFNLGKCIPYYGCISRARALLDAIDDTDKFEILMSV